MLQSIVETVIEVGLQGLGWAVWMLGMHWRGWGSTGACDRS